ncbi:hypothetical protein [Lachnobacterium bovis]|nr:hypothetical protein [Lachnobacterium bovis]
MKKAKETIKKEESDLILREEKLNNKILELKSDNFQIKKSAK